MTTHEIRLAGCRPEPLASYLKALGILRLVGEQADPGVVARWDVAGFVIQSALDEEGLEDFLLRQYRPTPVVSPWNSSSGFGPEGVGELQVIEASTDERLAGYRRAIAVARSVLARFSDKAEIMSTCRSELPDECVQWMDAAVVLTPGSPAYPPLLGTGGNVGRLELSRNFHRRLLDVLAMKEKDSQRAKAAQRSEAWLQDALWDLAKTAGIKESPGQFDPGSTGGTNSSPAGKASSVLNPWDYVLMLEGSMLFASGSARRLGVGAAGRSAAPFTADTAPVGYAGAAPNESVKGEIWLPLWERFVPLPELRRLMAEGRIDWRGRHARTGLDFAKAASTLGVDRGIAAFERYVLAERFGQASVAVPAGRVEVGQGRESVLPLADLDGWLGRVRRGGNPPTGVSHALRRVDLASFEVTRGTDGALARLLVEVAALEMAVGRASGFRARAGVLPVSGLAAHRWVAALVGPAVGSTGLRGALEMRLAMALASAHDRTEGGRVVSAALRTMLRPIHFDRRGAPVWTEVPSVEGFGVQPVIGVVARAHVRRTMELLRERKRSQMERRPDAGPGLPTRFAYGRSVALADLAALVAGAVNEGLFADLLGACMLLDWREDADLRRLEDGVTPAEPVIPPALAVLGPFYARQPRSTSGPGLVAREPTEAQGRIPEPLKPEPEWPAMLVAGRAEPVLTRALRRLRIAGHDPVLRDGGDFHVDRPRAINLAAALLFPLSGAVGERLLRRTCPPDPQPENVPSNHRETEEVDDVQP